MNFSPETGATAGKKTSWLDSEQLAGRLFIGWMVILFVFDLLTLRSFPVPCNDEALFTDPAASLVLQGHWASTLWYARSDFIFFGGNMPAYGFLLVPWLWLWGVSAAAVRSLNCVLGILALLAAWFSIKRLNLIPSPRIRLVTFWALSLCYPISFNILSGRPDALGMLIFAVSALFWSSPSPKTARAGLFLCAILAPFMGTQYAFYLPVLLGVLLWMGGKPVLGRVGAIILGCGLGALLLLAYYQFIAGWGGLLANTASVQGDLPSGFLARFKAMIQGQILRYYLGRPHFVLLIGMAVLLAVSWKNLTRSSRRILPSAVIILLIPGVVMGYVSHFMAPYHWLAVAPAMILLAAAASQSWGNLGFKTRVLCGFLALGLACSGRIVFATMGWVFDDANYVAQIEKTAAAQLHPGEIVFTDPQLYYLLKPRAKQIYFSEIIPKLTQPEKDSVSLAFLRSTGDFDVAWFTRNFGGNWVHVTDLPTPGPKVTTNKSLWFLLGFFHAGDYIGHPLSVYRRVGAE